MFIIILALIFALTAGFCFEGTKSVIESSSKKPSLLKILVGTSGVICIVTLITIVLLLNKVGGIQ